VFFTNKKRKYPNLVELAVHWYFYVAMAYILIQRAQKRHNLIELYRTYCGDHVRKSTQKIQEIREFLSHTDWVYIVFV